MSKFILPPAGLALALLVTSIAPLAAQVAEGNRAWIAGDYGAARIAYERALEADSTSVRANYRLAVLVSWEGRLDSALVLLRRARRVEPEEPDVLLYEAKVLSWIGRFDAAIQHYDTLLTMHPERRDAAFGRAQTLAWASRFHEADSAFSELVASDSTDSDAMAGRAQVAAWHGDFATAIRRYQEILARQPDNAQALIGLAQVYHWQGRERLAAEQVDQALARDSTSREGREVRAAIRAAQRPQVEGSLGWSNDSDDNTAWWQSLGSSLALADGLRGFGSVALLEASDPLRNATRVLGEVGASYAFGNAQLTGAVGARRLDPDTGSRRTPATYRLAASYRIAPPVGVGIGYSHYPFDETALLIGLNLDWDALEANLDATLREGLSLGAASGISWLSDNNRRRFVAATVTQRLWHRRVSVGLNGRIQGYDFKGTGYFSPDRFMVGEVRAGYTYTVRKWEAGASGGLGLQQVGKGASSQSEWHLEGRVARKWRAINELALSAGISNSAVSSTTGAFRYKTAALTLRLGL